eukprot:jgi/Mesvir1/4047/Mv09577-RA.1
MACTHDLTRKSLNELIVLASGRDAPAPGTCPGMRGHAVSAILDVIEKDNPGATKRHKNYSAQLKECLADNMVCHKDILVREMAFNALVRTMFRPEVRVGTCTPFMLLQANLNNQRIAQLIMSRPAYMAHITAGVAWCQQALTIAEPEPLIRHLAPALRLCKMACTMAAQVAPADSGAPLLGPGGMPLTSHDIIADRIDPYLAAHPDDVDALLCRGVIFGSKGDKVRATEFCSRAVAAAPEDPFPLALLGSYLPDAQDERRVVYLVKAWRMYEKKAAAAAGAGAGPEGGAGAGEVEPECLHMALVNSAMQQQRWSTLDASLRRYLEVYSMDEPNYARHCYLLALVTLAGLARWPDASPEERLREFQGLVARARAAEEHNRRGYGTVDDCHVDVADYLAKRYADRSVAERVTGDSNSMNMWWIRSVPVRCGACGRLDRPGKLGGRLKKCSRCMQAYFCGPACQQLMWKEHKTQCKPPEKSTPAPAPVDEGASTGDAEAAS